jgi:GNAT superfamily N-acetyltransferase
MSITIRHAIKEDAKLLCELIYEFAEHVKHNCSVTEELFIQEMFCERPAAEALIAEENGDPVGFAIYFPTFSTFSGRKRLYLEDLFVRPDARGKGTGMALFEAVSRVAVERGCAVLEWSVLDWNTRAQEFYKRLGAEAQSQYIIYRLDEKAMGKLGEATKELM